MLRNGTKIGKNAGRPNGSAAVAKQRLMGALELDRSQCERLPEQTQRTAAPAR
jgi:hypothetical protein